MPTPRVTEFQELACTLGWLAAEGAEALVALPRVRDKIDTLALDYFYAREVIYRAHGESLDSECVAALRSLDRMLEAHAGAGHESFWTAEALREDLGWVEIREAARATLLVFAKHVRTWWPTTFSGLEALIADQVSRLDPEQLDVFEHVLVPIQRVAIERDGRLAPALIIARSYGRVIFWDDIEGGFGWATMDPDGALCDYGPGHCDLAQILTQVIEDDDS